LFCHSVGKKRNLGKMGLPDSVACPSFMAFTKPFD
jgi:hypothetical protein